MLQARLRRTLGDVPGLDNVRLCKGIYLEPAEIAYQEAEEIRTSFRAALAAGKKDEATRAFTRVVDEFPQSLYVSDAKE